MGTTKTIAWLGATLVALVAFAGAAGAVEAGGPDVQQLRSTIENMIAAPGPGAEGTSPVGPLVEFEDMASDGVGAGEAFDVAWRVQATEPTDSLYRVEYRHLDGANPAWTPVSEATECTGAVALGGSCHLVGGWTPPQNAATTGHTDGNYALRVLVLPTVQPNQEFGAECLTPDLCDVLAPLYVDTTPPVAHEICVQMAGGGCAGPGDIVPSEILAIGVGASDNLALGGAMVEAFDENGDPVASCDASLPPGVDTLEPSDLFCTLDVSAGLNDGGGYVLFGDVTLKLTPRDRVGQTHAITQTVHVDTNGGDPLVLVRAVHGFSRHVNTGSSPTFVYGTMLLNSGTFGAAGDVAPAGTVITVHADGDQMCQAPVDLLGKVQCSFTRPEGAHLLVASAAHPGMPELDSIPAEKRVAWTSIACTLSPMDNLRAKAPGHEAGSPAGTLFANPTDIYRVAVTATLTHSGNTIRNFQAQAALIDGDGERIGFFGPDGLAYPSVVQNEPAVRTYDVEVRAFSLTPGDCGNVTITWGELAFSNAFIENVTGDTDGGVMDAWHDVGDTIKFGFDVALRIGPGAGDLVSAEGAELSFAAVSTDTLVVDDTGHVEVTRTFDMPTRVTPVVSLVSTPQEITATDPDPLALFGEQRWAKLFFSDAMVTNDDEANTEPNWHDVGDDVAFDYKVMVQPGQGTDDAVPLQGVATSFTLDGVSETLTSNSEGLFSTTRTVNDVLVETPAVAFLSAPHLLTAHEFPVPFFPEQIWTQVVLGMATDFWFVNVGDTIEVTVNAMWAHDSSLVDNAVVDILDAADLTLATCNVTNGEGTCEVTKDVVYDGGLFASLLSTDKGITAVVGDTSTDAVWTKIVVSNISYDDAFANVGQVVTMTADANYAHTGNPIVVSAQLALADGALAACMVDGVAEIVDGTLTVELSCDEVVDEGAADAMGLPLAVTSNPAPGSSPVSVHLLAEELFFQAVWTGLVIDFSVAGPDGELSSPSVIDHNTEVTFTVTGKLAHLVDGSGTPAPAGSAIQLGVSDGSSFDGKFEMLADGGNTIQTKLARESGRFDFTGAGKTLVGLSADITHIVSSTPDPFSLRWSSIGFDGVTCRDLATDSMVDCGAIPAGHGVEVSVRAIAEDTRGDAMPLVLDGALVRVDGTEMTADGDGRASAMFLQSAPACQVVELEGLEATIDGQFVDWDTRVDLDLCWV